MKTKTSCNGHPMLMFWLGLLTGSIIVGLTFLYRLYAVDVEASVLRFKTTPFQTTSTITTLVSPTTTKTAPVAKDNPDPWMPAK